MPNFQFGGSGGFEGGPLKQRRERAGGEIQYRDTRLTLTDRGDGARDGNLRRFGWYGLGAVRPTTHLQLVARYDSWDRDLSHELSLFDATERQIDRGRKLSRSMRRPRSRSTSSDRRFRTSRIREPERS